MLYSYHHCVINRVICSHKLCCQIFPFIFHIFFGFRCGFQQCFCFPGVSNNVKNPSCIQNRRIQIKECIVNEYKRERERKEGMGP